MRDRNEGLVVAVACLALFFMCGAAIKFVTGFSAVSEPVVATPKDEETLVRRIERLRGLEINQIPSSVPPPTEATKDYNPAEKMPQDYSAKEGNIYLGQTQFRMDCPHCNKKIIVLFKP
jgi:hypothetical protein